MGQSQQPEQRRQQIAVIGNYLPRQCGIATFTTDFCEALAAEAPEASIFAIPVNDTEEGYAYPPRVRFEIAESDLESYRRAADFLNVNGVDVVVLQHEYGIFGGKAGSHILALLRELRMPIVTTLHTILREPDRTQREVLDELAQLSERLVVMSEHAVAVPDRDLRGSRDEDRPHPARHPRRAVRRSELLQGPVRRRGQDGAADLRAALARQGHRARHRGAAGDPRALSRRPLHRARRDAPARRAPRGRDLSPAPRELARELGVEKNVIFYNRFVSLDELVEFIGAADIYITPYLNAEQITSGTLAYAVGTGKAVISTPYWYAEELLADERGVLVPFKDPAAIAKSVIELLENEAERHAMRKRAFL